MIELVDLFKIQITKEHQPFSCVHGVDLEALRNFVLRHHHLQPSPNGICHENAIERVAFCQLWNISVEVAQLHSICNVTRSLLLCGVLPNSRSEERRVGKECRSRWSL